MTDQTACHVTRIYVNRPRQSPSPIQPPRDAPVCTSTPIINPSSSNLSSKEQMARLAKEAVATKQFETFIRKPQSPPPPTADEFVIISKLTGQSIDFNRRNDIDQLTEGIGTIGKKKKKQRQSIAEVPPPPLSTRSSKSSDDGEFLVPINGEMPSSKRQTKTNFTSYDGIQMFTFTLDDD